MAFDSYRDLMSYARSTAEQLLVEPCRRHLHNDAATEADRHHWSGVRALEQRLSPQRGYVRYSRNSIKTVIDLTSEADARRSWW